MTARRTATGSCGSRTSSARARWPRARSSSKARSPTRSGRLDRGFVQMAEMVNWSRLSNGVKSTALMRRALHDAMTVAHGRVVFGKRIVDQPLARRQLLKMMLPRGAGALALLHDGGRARPRRGRQPGGGGAGAHPDAGAEIPLDARCAESHRRCARDARRRRLHRGVRAGPPVARRASRLDLGGHQQHRGARCDHARGRPPWRARRARRRPACAAEREHPRFRKAGATGCARWSIAPSRLRNRSRPIRRTKPMRAAPPRRSIMWRAP